MQIITHRRNTISELKATSPEYGVETDLRSYGDRLIVHHEPFVDAVDFSEWIIHYHHKTLILNVKEEGIEYRVKDIVERNGIKDYFFLDLSFPALIKMVDTREKRIAVRFSEYESVETALALAGKVDWVWVDCFTKMPLNKEIYRTFKEWGFKICLVSPDLVGRPEDIPSYKQYLVTENIMPDAICTKIFNIDMWK